VSEREKLIDDGFMDLEEEDGDVLEEQKIKLKGDITAIEASRKLRDNRAKFE